MKTQSWILAVALMLTACGRGSSSATQPSLTPPASSSMTEWKVTQRFVSVSGPDNCWVREQRERWAGAVFPDLPMSVNRSIGSITLESRVLPGKLSRHPHWHCLFGQRRAVGRRREALPRRDFFSADARRVESFGPVFRG